MAKIQLNGKKRVIKDKMRLFELISKLKLNNKKIAIELNGKIISKTIYKKFILKNKDKIEIVHFIGGG